MRATYVACVGGEEAADSGFGHWVAVRRGVLVLYFISVGVCSAPYGIPVQRELVVAWVCGALACASLGRPWREVLRLVRDWLPIVIVLSAYDFTRGAADSLGIGVHVHPMIDFDRFVFFGTTPTEWLQAHVNDPTVVNWLDVAFTLIYTSYFIVPFTVAGVPVGSRPARVPALFPADRHPLRRRPRRRLMTVPSARSVRASDVRRARPRSLFDRHLQGRRCLWRRLAGPG